MKVILYMATTINGLIAGENDEVDWVSENSWKSYLESVKEADCAVIGRRTYELMPKDEFVEGVIYVVFTRKKQLPKKISSVRFTDKKPSSVLESLEKEGMNQVCICGGGKINSLFMKENFIDEIYLDIEPLILGKGIRLFFEEDFKVRLELIGMKKLSPNEIQLHYKVKK